MQPFRGIEIQISLPVPAKHSLTCLYKAADVRRSYSGGHCIPDRVNVLCALSPVSFFLLIILC